MWKTFLPHELTLTLNPRYDSTEQQLRCTYQVDDLPLLDWIAKRIIKLIGNATIENIKVTPEEIIFNIPKKHLPYQIADISIGEITIHLKKE